MAQLPNVTWEASRSQRTKEKQENQIDGSTSLKLFQSEAVGLVQVQGSWKLKNVLVNIAFVPALFWWIYSKCSQFKNLLGDLQPFLGTAPSIYSCILRVWLGLQVLLKLAIFHLGLSFNKWPGDPFLMRRRANFYIKKFQTKWKFGTSSSLGLPSLNWIWARCWVLKFVII